MSGGLLNYADVPGALLNLCELEKLITADVGIILNQEFNTEQAFPYQQYESSVYPKWLNGITEVRPDYQGNYEDSEPYAVSIELQLGKRTQGYDGKLEQTLNVWVPYTLAALRAFPRLQTPTRPQVPLNLLECKCRVNRQRAPGDIIAAQFILTMEFSVYNLERD